MSPQVVVAGGAGDNAAAAVGLGLRNTGEGFVSLGTSGVVFKILVALIDTPLLYLSVNWIRSYYKLEINEEIKL